MKTVSNLIDFNLSRNYGYWFMSSIPLGVTGTSLFTLEYYAVQSRIFHSWYLQFSNNTKPLIDVDYFQLYLDFRQNEEWSVFGKENLTYRNID